MRLSRGKPIEPVLLTGKHIDHSGERIGIHLLLCTFITGPFAFNWDLNDHNFEGCVYVCCGHKNKLRVVQYSELVNLMARYLEVLQHEREKGLPTKPDSWRFSNTDGKHCRWNRIEVLFNRLTERRIQDVSLQISVTNSVNLRGYTITITTRFVVNFPVGFDTISYKPSFTFLEI